jgi:hypothetical protein
MVGLKGCAVCIDPLSGPLTSAAGHDGNRRFEAPLAWLEIEQSSPLSGEPRLSQHLKLDHPTERLCIDDESDIERFGSGVWFAGFPGNG